MAAVAGRRHLQRPGPRPRIPFEVARRGYAVGSTVLAAALPAHQGPTAAAPVAMDDTGLEWVDGVKAKQIILTQLAQAREVDYLTELPQTA